MKRCVCGRSARPPICDGSHRSEGWSCSADRFTDLAFASVGALENLALRLAARGGALASRGHRCRRLVALTDGTDLEALRALVDEVQAERRTLVWTGTAPVSVWPGWEHHHVDEGPGLWAELLAVLEQAPVRPEELPSPVFLSHAALDEARLEPVARSLREGFGVELFLCSDSIRAGDWRSQIEAALERSGCLLFALSEAASRSVFCHWELGWATARGLDVRVVGLDDAAPTAPIQHLHVSRARRLLAARPWLEEQEALLLATLAALR